MKIVNKLTPTPALTPREFVCSLSMGAVFTNSYNVTFIKTERGAVNLATGAYCSTGDFSDSGTSVLVTCPNATLVLNP